jgi:hypothetical protein
MGMALQPIPLAGDPPSAPAMAIGGQTRPRSRGGGRDHSHRDDRCADRDVASSASVGPCRHRNGAVTVRRASGRRC